MNNWGSFSPFGRKTMDWNYCDREEMGKSLISDCLEIKRILIASINTAKENGKWIISLYPHWYKSKCPEDSGYPLSHKKRLTVRVSRYFFIATSFFVQTLKTQYCDVSSTLNITQSDNFSLKMRYWFFHVICRKIMMSTEETRCKAKKYHNGGKLWNWRSVKTYAIFAKRTVLRRMSWQTGWV